MRQSLQSSSHPSPPPPPDPVMVLKSSNAVTCLTFDNDDVLFSGHQDGQIQEWNLQTQRAKVSWSGHSDAVISVCCCPVGESNLLISRGRDGLVKAWRNVLTNGQSQWTSTQHIPCALFIFCNAVAFQSHKSTFVAVPSEEMAKIQVFNLSKISDKDRISNDTESCISTLEPAPVREFGMCMKMCSPLGTSSGKLVIAYESGQIALWDSFHENLIANSKIHEESVMCLDSIKTEVDKSASGSEVGETFIGVSASTDKVIHKWTISNGQIVKLLSVNATNPGFCDIKIRPDSRIFVSAGWDHSCRVFSFKKLKPLAVLTYHKQSVQCLSFGHDKMIATGSKDGYIALWDVYKNV